MSFGWSYRVSRCCSPSPLTQHRLAIGGMVFLALSMSGVVFLIFDVLFGTLTAVIISLLVASAFAWFWYGLPITQRARDV